MDNNIQQSILDCDTAEQEALLETTGTAVDVVKMSYECAESMEWQELFAEDVIFFGQIWLSDIVELDTENKLPHTGYFYIFLDVEIYPYQAMAYYYDGEPNVVIDDFNETEPQFAHLNED